MTAHETIITGDTAVVRALPGKDLAPVARALLDAAGNRAGEIRTITNAPGVGLAVPVTLARKAGLVHEPDPPAGGPAAKPEPTTADKTAKAPAPKPKSKARKGK